MFNQAIAGQSLPVRLSFDHDPLFEFHRWHANLRILGIESVRSVPYAPKNWNRSKRTTTSTVCINLINPWKEPRQRRRAALKPRNWPVSTNYRWQSH
jgi:hypothetical protein